MISSYTGLQHGIHHEAEPWGLSPNFTIMPQYLRYYKKGYTPTYRGFDSFYGFYNSGEDYYRHEIYSPLFLYMSHQAVNGGDAEFGYKSPAFAREHFSYIQDLNRSMLAVSWARREKKRTVKRGASGDQPRRKEEERAARGWGRAGTIKPFWLVRTMSIPGAFHQRVSDQHWRKWRALTIPS
ncbi:hypothetical protein HPB47_019446 [Ixodes persulcatus]|uniref:Uncharacterized protein n=1 Tax=Ixodes persulcatus TaxID=34615 RepID=A0AC60QI89_IXOPE|nr:hypothetical protein HPB47_019446 [Ixodes persulcatus]